MALVAITKTVNGGKLRLIKSDTGKSLYLVGDTKPVKDQIKELQNLAFPPKWNNKKKAWNIVPAKDSMESVLDQLRVLFAIQAQQAKQMPEVSGSVAWVEPPPKKVMPSVPSVPPAHVVPVVPVVPGVPTMPVVPAVPATRITRVVPSTRIAPVAPVALAAPVAPSIPITSPTICKGVKVNGEPCKYKAKYGDYCGFHRK
jgi:hypothetical protein